MSDSDQKSLSELQGQIERITFQNEENGYTIARLKVYGQRDLVTITGNMTSPAPGEILKIKGDWINHPKYGVQFKIVHYQTITPATVYGIQKYIGSGFIKGIGPVMAKRIVKKFGKETLNVIENNPDHLIQVEGVGQKRIDTIKNTWNEQKEIREVMLFLQGHGVSSGYATKIFKQYKESSIKIVGENPYRLAEDIFGIGFLTADRIAENLGFKKESEIRIEAGILYVLNRLSEEGHVYYPFGPLVTKCAEILDVPHDIVKKAITKTVHRKKIVIEDLNSGSDDSKADNRAVYLHFFHFCESRISIQLKNLVNYPHRIRKIDSIKAVEWIQNQLTMTLGDKQKDAIKCILKNKTMVLTGGPGTGKTTIINAILKIFSVLKVKAFLAAPTGRAAKRMSEATGQEARTIHRMLEYSFKKGGFKKNDKNPLTCDLLIIDEASMIDTILMHHLVKAIPLNAVFIIVGDVNQLPSVGAGNILKDIISSRVMPVVELNEIFRQAKKSRIIINAHRINNGDMPYVQSFGKKNDFFFIEKEAPETVLNVILDLVKERIPKKFGFDPVNDIQILTPMHKGVIGAGNLNLELQNALNPSKNGLIRENQNYRVNDKVMQIKNNYQKEVFNGDIGKIAKINLENQKIVINFDGQHIDYDFSDLDEIILAYAITVHKSQGSEYPAVIIPMMIQHYMLLQRNLIYTAITRGKKLVVIVGTKKAMAISIRNNNTEKRYTHLNYRLS